MANLRAKSEAFGNGFLGDRTREIQQTNTPNAQQAVWRQSGCLFVDSVVVIWKLTARPSLSEPPPERQAAGR